MTDQTTMDILSDEREELIRQAVATATPQIIQQVITQVKTMLAEKYFTPGDLKEFSQDVISAATSDAAARIEKVQAEQSAWQMEQAAKLDKFVTEMRDTINTLAPLSKLESLSSNQEDYRRHTESNLGEHREAIDELKSRLKTIETTTSASIAGIRTDTDLIKKSARVMQTTVSQLVANDAKRQAELDKLKETAEQRHQKTTDDINALQDDIRKQDVLLSEQRRLWSEFSIPIDLLVNGNQAANIKGFHERMTNIEQGLDKVLWLFNSWGGRGVLTLIGAIFTAVNHIH